MDISKYLFSPNKFEITKFTCTSKSQVKIRACPTIINSDWYLRTMTAIVSAAVNQVDYIVSFWLASGSVLTSIQLNFWGVNKIWNWASKLIALKNIRGFFYRLNNGLEDIYCNCSIITNQSADTCNFKLEQILIYLIIQHIIKTAV